MNRNKIEAAIQKAREQFPSTLIWGALFHPETADYPDEITVFGGCSEEQWRRAISFPDRRQGINHHQLATYKVADL